MTMLTQRPTGSEFAPYYGKYVEKVPDGSVLETLQSQITDTVSLLRSAGEAKGEHRYGPDKWSIKEVVGHMCDSERIFAYRLLRIARGDETPLPGFEQDDYIANGRFGSRSLDDLIDEFALIRASTVALVKNLDQAAMSRMGTASGFPVSARALAWIIAGHERHHISILRERYLA